MKKNILFILGVLYSLALHGQEQAADKDLILNTIDKAYVQGLQNHKDFENIKKHWTRTYEPGWEMVLWPI